MASEVSLAAAPGLEFEEPILSIEAKIRELERIEPSDEQTEESLRMLRRQWTDETRRIYSQLNPWQIVQVSRLFAIGLR